MPVLPDSLQRNLKLVFCGTAASDVSAQVGAYYANPTNAFWRTLHTTGLTPRLYQPQEFATLLAIGIGFTDLAKNAQGNDAVLIKEDFDVAAFREKMLHYQPEWIAFTSKKSASLVLGKHTADIAYGLQHETIGQSRLWVLTSPSGSARRYWDQAIWQALSERVRK